MPKARPFDRAKRIRDESASARKGEIDTASPIAIDALVAESPSEQTVTLPVGALAAWRRHIRQDVLEEVMNEQISRSVIGPGEMGASER